MHTPHFRKAKGWCRTNTDLTHTVFFRFARAFTATEDGANSHYHDVGTFYDIHSKN